MFNRGNFPAQRLVFQAEARAWLAANQAPVHSSVITSLPDVSEVPHMNFETWRSWFIDTAQQIIHWIPDDGVAIFFQSDIRHRGALVNKDYFIMRAADDAGAVLLWHKIVCRRPPGSIAAGRPSYSHMLCVAHHPMQTPLQRPGPDVIADAGTMSWPRAMGEAACQVACRYLLNETPTRVVVDPFCGQGSALASANAHGLDAIGVDLSGKRCRLALEAGSMPG